MATTPATRTTTKARTRPATGLRSEDAVTILMSDHAKVKKLFKQFDKTEDFDEKQSIAEEVCKELTAHTKIEEEIFYPAVRLKIHDDDLMNEAIVEHTTAKDLITKIQNGKPTDALYVANVTVLAEYIDHHVKEEETEMFPMAKKAKVDLVELGERMKARKQELMKTVSH